MGAYSRDNRRVVLACLSDRGKGADLVNEGFFRASCNGCAAVDED